MRITGITHQHLQPALGFQRDVNDVLGFQRSSAVLRNALHFKFDDLSAHQMQVLEHYDADHTGILVPGWPFQLAG